MMKKFVLIMAALALLAPTAALAAEFSLGGFIKLSTFWDSTQEGVAVGRAAVIQRNNDAGFQHGNFHMTSQESRYNFTIKGPELWGAKTTAFIEMDFAGSYDSNVSGVTGAAGPNSISNAYQMRLRHAMFRLNWPETELLFGQYWGMFAEFTPEAAGFLEFSTKGAASYRAPQIRLTQKFLGDWTVAAAIMEPYSPGTADANFNTTAIGFPAGSSGTTYLAGGAIFPGGRNAETPKFEGKIAYERDLWGKAAYFGRPRGFTAQLTAAWERIQYRTNAPGASLLNTFGQNAFGATSVVQDGQQYLSPWAVGASLFVPVIPTYSANLAGTASITTQWFIGQGTTFIDGSRDNDNSWFQFIGRSPSGAFIYDRKLMNQFGGFVQGQYYFTSQWYMNAAWGMRRDYGIDTSTSALLAGQQAGNLPGYKYASNNDQLKLWQQFDLTLWYRPIQALRFGLQYAYQRADFLQKTNNPTIAGGAVQNSQGATNVGESHRLQFVAFMYF
ncbi:MAG: hypothetical protein M1438_00230 [Deltaproteobacteria bacterium]|nr:hypothetical protein [Deltaproteobacteria bacterium]